MVPDQLTNATGYLRDLVFHIPVICPTDEDCIGVISQSNIVSTVSIYANCFLVGSDDNPGITGVTEKLNIRVECIVFPSWVSRDQLRSSFVGIVFDAFFRCRPATPERFPVRDVAVLE